MTEPTATDPVDAAALLDEINRRQDEILASLDELNDNVELVLREATGDRPSDTLATSEEQTAVATQPRKVA